MKTERRLKMKTQPIYFTNKKQDMNKIFVAIMMILSTSVQAQKLSTLPDGSVSNNTHFAGVEIVGGVKTTYKYSIASLAALLGPGQNISNTSLRPLSNFVQHWNKKIFVIDSVATVYFTDTTGDTVKMPQYRNGTVALAGDGITPFVVVGVAAGTGATVSSVTGDCNRGFVVIHTGSSSMTTGIIFKVTVNTAFPNNLESIVVAGDDVTAAIFGSSHIYSVYISHSTFQVMVGSTGSNLAPNTNYTFSYIVGN